MTLLLASKSETRRAMLAAAGVPFERIETDVDEDRLKEAFRAEGMDATALAEALASRKALAAAAPRGALVLGSDQTLERDDGKVLDKPKSVDDAHAQLRSLSGRIHRLHSAAAIVEDGQVVWTMVETVTMTVRPLSEPFLGDYLKREYEEVRWNVGGYRVEGYGAQLFERIDGSHFAVLGMPLLPLLAYLRQRGLIAS